MTDGEVVYEPTVNTTYWEIEYYETKYQLWTNAEGTWTFDGKDVTIKSRYHAEHPATEMADLFAYEGYRVRVLKYENKED